MAKRGAKKKYTEEELKARRKEQKARAFRKWYANHKDEFNAQRKLEREKRKTDSEKNKVYREKVNAQRRLKYEQMKKDPEAYKRFLEKVHEYVESHREEINRKSLERYHQKKAEQAKIKEGKEEG